MVMKGLLAKFRPEKSDGKMGDSDKEMMRAAYLQSPLRTVKLALNMSKEQYEGLLDALNASLKGEESFQRKKGRKKGFFSIAEEKEIFSEKSNDKQKNNRKRKKKICKS